jgi:hypothetical protein
MHGSCVPQRFTKALNRKTKQKIIILVDAQTSIIYLFGFLKNKIYVVFKA